MINERVQQYFSTVIENGFYQEQRKKQAKYWLYEMITARLKREFYNDLGVSEQLTALEQKVVDGESSPTQVATHLLDSFYKKRRST